MVTKRKVFITAVSGALLLALYMLIFSFSAQDAEESGSLSRMISEKCVEFFNQLSGRHWSEEVMESFEEYFEHSIRKLAHFMVYACMGVLVFILWIQWILRRKALYFLTVVWVFLSAAGDEFHQLFVPGRYGSFADVLLDTAGGIFGMLFCVLVEKCYRKLRHGRSKKQVI